MPVRLGLRTQLHIYTVYTHFNLVQMQFVFFILSCIYNLS